MLLHRKVAAVTPDTSWLRTIQMTGKLSIPWEIILHAYQQLFFTYNILFESRIKVMASNKE